MWDAARTHIPTVSHTRRGTVVAFNRRQRSKRHQAAAAAGRANWGGGRRGQVAPLTTTLSAHLPVQGVVQYMLKCLMILTNPTILTTCFR